MLKIYFCGSIRGGRQDINIYIQLVSKLKEYGTVLTEIVADPQYDGCKLKQNLHIYSYKCIKFIDRYAVILHFIYEEYMEWLQEADIVIAEVTQPSLGVGFEVGQALAMGKKIVCLYHPSQDKKLSSIIAGILKSDKYQLTYYSENEVNDVIDNIFKDKK